MLDESLVRRRRSFPRTVRQALVFLTQHSEDEVSFVQETADKTAGRRQLQRAAQTALPVVARALAVLQLRLQQLQLDLSHDSTFLADKLGGEPACGIRRIARVN